MMKGEDFSLNLAAGSGEVVTEQTAGKSATAAREGICRFATLDERLKRLFARQARIRVKSQILDLLPVALC
jgi:hypothetical protein